VKLAAGEACHFPCEGCLLVYWIVATSVTGEHLGTEYLPDLPPEDPSSHSLALTTEFQQLLRACWPGSQWMMVNPRQYMAFRADAGVLGTITLAFSATDYIN